MKYMKNKYIKYKKAELERFLKDTKSCVKKVNRTETLAVSPHHLATIKNYITCVLNAKIGKHHRDLDGIVLDFRNVKLLNTNSELRFEDPLVRITIITDYYVFRPHRGAVLRGVIKHTNQHSLGVILYRVFTVSIKLDGGKAGKKLAINQEIEFKVIGFNFDNKFASIDGEFIKSYELPATAKLNGSAKKSDEDEKEVSAKTNQKPVVVKQEPASRQASSDSSSDEEEPAPSTSLTKKVTIKKEKDQSDSSSSDEPDSPASLKKLIKNEVASQSSSDSSSDEDEASPIKQEPLTKRPDKKPVLVKREPVTNGNGVSDSSSSEEEPVKAEPSRKSVKLVKKEPVNGHSDSSDDEISAILKAHKVVAKTESHQQRKRKREETSSDSSDSDRDNAPPAKRSNNDTFGRVMLAPVRRKIFQSQSDSDSPKTSTPKLVIKPEKVDAPSAKKKVKKSESDDEDELERTIMALLSQSKDELSSPLNGKIKKEKQKTTVQSVEYSPSILKASRGEKKKKGSRKSVQFFVAE